MEQLNKWHRLVDTAQQCSGVSQSISLDHNMRRDWHAELLFMTDHWQQDLVVTYIMQALHACGLLCAYM